ncbi:hypothetical protein A0U40_13090 [[Bacillus] sp. KCTC 13219]|nr:hypothetical protein A0U40_13090 [[Bacillus] sp. KCTC 13219]
MMAIFVLVPVVCLVIFGTIYIVGRLLSRFQATFNERFYKLLVIYVVIGLIATVCFPYLPNAQKAILSDKEIKEKLDEIEYLNQLVQEKRFDEINPDYLKEQLTFTVTNEELTLKSNMEFLGTHVIVTWRDDKTSNDVYASYYEFPFIFSGIDVTNNVSAPQIHFEKDTLLISEINREIIYHRVIPKIWTIEHYYERFDNEGYSNYGMGQQIIHLNVPKHINIIDNSGMIQYIYY